MLEIWTILISWSQPVKMSCVTLRENCPNTEVFLVRIFPNSDWIRRDTEYLSAFSPNAAESGKIRTRKTCVFGHFSCTVIFMETKWFQIFISTLNNYWSGSSRKFFTLYIFILQKRIQVCSNHQRWSVLRK